MSLKRKFLLGSFLILLFFASFIFLSSFLISNKVIEESIKVMEKDLRESFLFFLEQQRKNIEIHIKDYSYWYEMGEFGVIKKDRTWLRDNLEPWVRNTFHYDLVALIKENKEVITKSSFEEISLRDLLPKNLKLESGFYITKKGVLIYSVSPVFDNYGKKYYKAFLIFGKIIDEKLLNFWEDLLRFGIIIKTENIAYFSNPNIPNFKFSSEYYFKDNYICLSIPIDAKNGSFEVKIYRCEDLLSKISTSLQRSLLLSLLVILILSIFLSNWGVLTILKPLETFQRNIEEISKGKYDLELNLNRKDEIGGLAKSFKKMIDKICEREKELTLAKELAEESSLKDELTGIPNRRFLYKYMEYLIKNKQIFALVFIDLDKFKGVNDLFGHTKGDKILIDVAQWFRKNLREEDKVIRYGGDEFCIILHNVKREEAEDILKRIYLKFLSENFLRNITLGFSYGITIFPEDGENLDKLLAKADGEMYKKKEKWGRE